MVYLSSSTITSTTSIIQTDTTGESEGDSTLPKNQQGDRFLASYESGEGGWADQSTLRFDSEILLDDDEDDFADGLFNSNKFLSCFGLWPICYSETNDYTIKKWSKNTGNLKSNMERSQFHALPTHASVSLEGSALMEWEEKERKEKEAFRGRNLNGNKKVKRDHADGVCEETPKTVVVSKFCRKDRYACLGGFEFDDEASEISCDLVPPENLSKGRKLYIKKSTVPPKSQEKKKKIEDKNSKNDKDQRLADGKDRMTSNEANEESIESKSPEEKREKNLFMNGQNSSDASSNKSSDAKREEQGIFSDTQEGNGQRKNEIGGNSGIEIKSSDTSSNMASKKNLRRNSIKKKIKETMSKKLKKKEEQKSNSSSKNGNDKNIVQQKGKVLTSKKDQKISDGLVERKLTGEECQDQIEDDSRNGKFFSLKTPWQGKKGTIVQQKIRELQAKENGTKGDVFGSGSSQKRQATGITQNILQQTIKEMKAKKESATPKVGTSSSASATGALFKAFKTITGKDGEGTPERTENGLKKVSQQQNCSESQLCATRKNFENWKTKKQLTANKQMKMKQTSDKEEDSINSNPRFVPDFSPRELKLNSRSRNDLMWKYTEVSESEYARDPRKEKIASWWNSKLINESEEERDPTEDCEQSDSESDDELYWDRYAAGSSLASPDEAEYYAKKMASRNRTGGRRQRRKRDKYDEFREESILKRELDDFAEVNDLEARARGQSRPVRLGEFYL